jgi:Flp pilus assembly protein TadG
MRMNIKKWKLLWVNEKGQGLVEFALIFSMLLMLLCMAVDVARVVDSKILLQSAACESIRKITTRGDMASEVSNALQDDYDRLNPADLQVNVTGGSDQKRNYTYHAHGKSGKYVGENCYFTYFDATVKLTYTVPIITPVGQLFFGKKMTISSGYTKMVVVGGFSW